MKTLILGLGNDLLSDDAVGLVVTRSLRERLQPGSGEVSVVESSLSGLALLDLFFGYERAIIVDGIRTGRRPAGSIVELRPEDLDPVVAPSPHYAGLPELFLVARHLGLPFPRDVRILAIETEDPWTIGGTLSAAVRGAVDEAAARVLAILAPDRGVPPAASPKMEETPHA